MVLILIFEIKPSLQSVCSKGYLEYVHLYTAAYLPDGNVSSVQHLSLLVISMLLQSSPFDPWCFIFLVELSDD